jgi:hypothetical protein
MIRCSQARRRILASRDARLSLAERLELDEHLQGCETCRALDVADAGLEEALAALPEPPVERLDLDVAVRAVRARIESAELEQAVDRARRARVRRWIGWSAAAAVVVALAAWMLLGRGESEPARRSEVVEHAPDPELPRTIEDPAAPLDEGAQPEPEIAQSTGEEVPPAQIPDPFAPESSELAQLEEPPKLSEAAEELPLDVERHERARAEVRAAFAQAVAANKGFAEDPSVLTARLAALDTPLKNAASEGWNVAALAERVLGDADAEVAGLSARWLGQKGDRLSIRTIAGVLRRPDAPASLRRQVALALLDDGEPGIAALVPALADAELRSLVLEPLTARGGTAPVDAVAAALAAAGDDAVAAADLANALSRLGERGIDALIEAVERGGPAAEVALSELRHTRGAPERLAALLAERAPARVVDVRVDAAARLGLAEVLPLLRERALDRAHRSRTLAQLAAFPGRGALAIALDLWSSSRFGEDELGLAARSILERDPLEGVALAGELEAPGQEQALHDLVDLLLAAESKVAAPALARLVGSPWLPGDERQWAALALAEFGTPGEAPHLTDVLRELQPEEARLAAACTLAIQALAGAPALREALDPDATGVSERLIALLERRPGDRHPAATISRAARLLEPWLESRTPERTRTTP